MICPKCRIKYPPRDLTCPDCTLALRTGFADAEATMAQSSPGDALIPFWDGQDMAFHSVLVDELELAGIPFYDESATILPTIEQISSIPPFARPRLGYQVAVLASHLEAAEKILENVETQTLPELSLPEGVDLFASEEPPAENFAEEEKIEIWAGADAERSQFLIDALQENNISLWLEKSADGQHLHVAAVDEGRAREIVREVTEASPPE